MFQYLLCFRQPSVGRARSKQLSSSRKENEGGVSLLVHWPQVNKATSNISVGNRMTDMELFKICVFGMYNKI
jgi:hypothetical protein